MRFSQEITNKAHQCALNELAELGLLLYILSPLVYSHKTKKGSKYNILYCFCAAFSTYTAKYMYIQNIFTVKCKKEFQSMLLKDSN